jgi:hypothetical protein
MSQEEYIDLLAVAVKYEVPAAVKKAKLGLLASNMPPALQLNLGRRFGFSDWVERAAHTIVRIPPLALLPRDIQLIGAESTGLLHEMHTKLSHHRASTSLMLPSLLATHAIGCRDQLRCLTVWKDVCLLLSRQILHPSSSVSDTELLEVLETQETLGTVMAGMSPECARQVKEKCRNALVGKDAWLIESVAARLSQ